MDGVRVHQTWRDTAPQSCREVRITSVEWPNAIGVVLTVNRQPVKPRNTLIPLAQLTAPRWKLVSE